MKKTLPFNIEAIKNGAKCVTRDEIPARYVHSVTVYCKKPHKFHIENAGYFWVDANGIANYWTQSQNAHDLFILGESETEQESPKESFYRLLNVGEEILATDEYWHEPSANWEKWGNDTETQFVSIARPPIRRLVTIPSPVSPWVRYEDRQPTKEDANENGFIVVCNSKEKIYSSAKYDQILNLTCWDMWMTPPPLPKPKRDFQRDFFAHQTEEFKSFWNTAMDEVKVTFKKEWEDKNL